jgi:hypothetical protein
VILFYQEGLLYTVTAKAAATTPFICNGEFRLCSGAKFKIVLRTNGTAVEQ